MYILLKEDGTYWAMFDTIERAIKEFAFISGIDVEEIVLNMLLERLRLEIDGNEIKLMISDYPVPRCISYVFINKEDL